MNKYSILIVDDEPAYLDLMSDLLNDEGYENIFTEKSPTSVLQDISEKNIDLVLCDIRFPEMSGLKLLELISQKYPKVAVIMVTGIDDVNTALTAIKLGAYDYITKPPDTDRLLVTIKRALEQKLLKEERDSLRAAESNFDDTKKKYFSDIITNSPQMHKVFDLVEIFAPTNETVLIVGETGTGKDLIARKIHEISPRKNKPFVEVNIASVSSSLFESELFGHQKGAFTGATEEKAGYFEAANGGTIFLDEIGELPKELQGKLLRTIQYGEITRIGSTKPIKLDIRIITATNKNLVEATEKEEFRTDLYYRLSRGFIKLPPLRLRDNDIELLSYHFLNIGNRTYDKSIPGFTNEIMSVLNNYHFPGNVRELENIILNAVAKTPDNEKISRIELPKNFMKNFENQSYSEKDLVTIEEIIEKHIKSVMNYAGGNIQKAAPILGVSERTLQRRLKKMREK